MRKVHVTKLPVVKCRRTCPAIRGAVLTLRFAKSSPQMAGSSGKRAVRRCRHQTSSQGFSTGRGPTLRDEGMPPASRRARPSLRNFLRRCRSPSPSGPAVACPRNEDRRIGGSRSVRLAMTREAAVAEVEAVQTSATDSRSSHQREANNSTYSQPIGCAEVPRRPPRRLATRYRHRTGEPKKTVGWRSSSRSTSAAGLSVASPAAGRGRPATPTTPSNGRVGRRGQCPRRSRQASRRPHRGVVRNPATTASAGSRHRRRQPAAGGDAAEVSHRATPAWRRLAQALAFAPRAPKELKDSGYVGDEIPVSLQRRGTGGVVLPVTAGAVGTASRRRCAAVV